MNSYMLVSIIILIILALLYFNTSKVKKINTNNTVKQPSNNTVKQPFNNTVKQPSNNTVKQPSNNTVKQPSNNTVKQPSNNTVKQPSNNTVKQPIDNNSPIKLPSDNLEIIDKEIIDCEGEWSEWSSCSVVPCGKTRQKTRNFNVIQAPNKLGNKCPIQKNQYIDCPVQPCQPIDCKGKWPPFEHCPDTCIQEGADKISVSRKFKINQLEQNGGHCPLRDNEQTSNCPVNYCPVDCKGEWSSFDSCPDTCIQEGDIFPSVSRTYNIIHDERHGGKCPLRDNTQTSNCPANLCSIDCSGNWVHTEDCPDTCIKENDNPHVINMIYDVTSSEKHGGNCPQKNQIKTSNCPVNYCPVDCKGEWSEWETCSDDCIPYGESPNFISRTYNVTKNESYGGECTLRGQIETSNCPVKYCPVDCKGEWGDWDYSCPTKCLNENDKPTTITRRFNLYENSKFNGDCSEIKNGAYQKSNCPVNYCPIDCEGKWSSFESCPDTCIQQGEQSHVVSRLYQVDQSERHGGKCPLRETEDTSNCPINYCPIDCKGEWGDWDKCTNQCDENMVTQRFYNIITSNQYSGKSCVYNGSNISHNQQQTSNCPFVSCPIDCEGEWSDYSQCSNLCNSNQDINRVYKVTTSNQYNGEFCKDENNNIIFDGDIVFYSNCPFKHCPVDCEGKWPSFESCSDACVDIDSNKDSYPVVTRKYEITKYPRYGGEACTLKGETETSNCPFKYCPVDCKGDWSDWNSQCSNLCNSNQEISRSYIVTTSNQFGGIKCDHENGNIETSNCPFYNCPIDCKGGWSEWNTCYNICDQQQEVKRVYKIVTSNQYNGEECDYKHGKQDTSNCPFYNCPIDCEGEWGNWNECVNQCGETQKTQRKYIMTTSNQYSGNYCKYNNSIVFNDDVETSNCLFELCPKDCTGKWTDWEECPTNKCYPEDYDGKGTQIHRRYFIEESANETGNCPLKDVIQESNCPVEFCSVPCEGKWGDWTTTCPSECIKITDETPTTTRQFEITKHAKYGGKECDNEHGKQETSNCKVNYCPVDCAGQWGNWEECTNRCNKKGETQRKYIVTTSNQYGGSYCIDEENNILFDNDTERSNCPFKKCSIDCEGEWSGWEKCPTNCLRQQDDIPKVKRYYDIYREKQHGGSNCPNENGVFEESNCPFEYCPIDCRGEWGNWSSECSNLCNSNQQISRTYNVTTSNQYNGYHCRYNNEEIVDGYMENSNCPFESCPINCEGGWSDWEECTNRCSERGVSKRTYIVTTSNEHGGQYCTDKINNMMKHGYIERSNCPFKQCSVDCEGEWGNWEKCPNYCIHEDDKIPKVGRYYSIYREKQHSGSDCSDDHDDFQESNCPVEYCAVDCEGRWGGWNARCSNLCDSNQEISRNYIVRTSNQYGGKFCQYNGSNIMDNALETSNCPFEHCSIDCEGEWGDWAKCTNRCGETQVVQREYKVTRSNQYNGYSCSYRNRDVADGYREFSNCPYEECSVDCYGKWTDWETCSDSCLKHTDVLPRVKRHFEIYSNQQHNGKKCDFTHGELQESNCHFEYCPFDCDGEWSDWENCPNYCINLDEDIPTVRRYYTVYAYEEHGGRTCSNDHNDFEESNCPVEYCPVDCEGHWEGWNSRCSNLCDSNQEITRNYTITRSNQYGGKECEHEDGKPDNSNCPFEHCAIDCKGEWSDWEDCGNVVCNEEKQTIRVYNVTTSNQYNGKYCHENNRMMYDGSYETSNCPFEHCPVDCEGEWSRWDYNDCPYFCIDGNTHIPKMRRYFEVYQNSQHGGSNCIRSNNDFEESNCPVEYCPIDCKGKWGNYSQCSNLCGSNQEVKRTYTVTRSNQYNGFECVDNNSIVYDGAEETSNCPFVNCPINCKGEWSDWETCDNTCDEEKQTTRVYNVTTSNQYDGEYCEENNLPLFDGDLETSNCPFEYCPIHCEGEWSKWEQCPDYCIKEDEDIQKIRRYYNVFEFSAYGGSNCPNSNNAFEESNCPVEYCPVDCQGDWGEWSSQCSNLCGSNQEIKRNYIVTTSNQYNGYDCYDNDNRLVYNGTEDTSNCPFVDCPINCEGGWSDWEQCTNACGEVQKTTRTYNVTTSNQYDGEYCDDNNKLVFDGDVETSNCPFEHCPVDCIGGFLVWSSLSHRCSNCYYEEDIIDGKGDELRREFIIHRYSKHNGTCKDEGKVETSNCPINLCPIDCEGEWGEWNSTCSNLCNSNQKLKREFIVKTSELYGVDHCVNKGKEDTSNCPFTHCSIDCEGEWSDWTRCTNGCGDTQQSTRTFTITTSNQYGGKPCREALSIDSYPYYHYFEMVNGYEDSKDCPFEHCPFNCIGGWGNWSTCPTQCRDVDDEQIPSRRRYYTIYSNNMYGGIPCSNEHNHFEDSNCSFEYCPIGCAGAWTNWDSSCSNLCNSNQLLTKTYKITTSNQFGGQSCKHDGIVVRDNQEEQSNCPYEYCPIDCKGDWGDWQQCPSNCIFESEPKPEIFRYYTIDIPSEHGGEECKYLDNQQDQSNCPYEYCPIDCDGYYEDWESCDVNNLEDCSDGKGAEIKHRFVITRSNQYGGSNCPATETSNCAITDFHCKDIQCDGKWRDWSPICTTNSSHDCTLNSKGAEITRSFNVTSQGQYGADNCPTTETSNCPITDAHCSNIDCEGDWSSWTTCTSNKTQICTNGIGAQTTRNYIVQTPSQYGGLSCPTTETSNCPATSDHCSNMPCVGRWGAWSSTCSTNSTYDCTLNGKGAEITRSFNVTSQGQFGADACPTTETSNCPVIDAHCSNIDCVGDYVQDTSECIADYNTSENCIDTQNGESVPKITNTYVITTSNQYGGAFCIADKGPTFKTNCPHSNCALPIDCKASWSSNSCLVNSCSEGIFDKVYNIDTPAQWGGSNCKLPQGLTISSNCTKHRWCADTKSYQPLIALYETDRQQVFQDIMWRGDDTWGGGECPTTCHNSEYPPIRIGTVWPTLVKNKLQPITPESTQYERNEGVSKVCPYNPCPGVYQPPDTTDRRNNGEKVNCEGSWSSWYGNCGSSEVEYDKAGKRYRVYTRTVSPKNGGEDCPHVHGEIETVKCPCECKIYWGHYEDPNSLKGWKWGRRECEKCPDDYSKEGQQIYSRKNYAWEAYGYKNDPDCIVQRPYDTTILRDLKCEKCPCSPGKEYHEGQCRICLPGTASGTDGTCTPCPSGQGSTSDRQSCEVCSDGKEVSNGVCTPCADGTAGTGGTCTPCTGTSVQSDDKTECITCPDGKEYRDGECIDCPTGTAGTGGRCTPCTGDLVQSDDKKSCVCEWGKHMDSGSCVSCNPYELLKETGKCGYNCLGQKKIPNSDRSTCVSCPTGQIGKSTGCELCPSGYMKDNDSYTGDYCARCYYRGKVDSEGSVPSISSDDRSACITCPSGQTTYDNQTCVLCPSGTAGRDGRCTPCPSGYFQSKNKTSCLTDECPAGETYNRADESCEACPVGTVSDGGTCTFCPPGEIPNASRDDCVACPSGHEVTNSFTCQECPVGKTIINHICSDCLWHSVPNNNKESCRRCPGGTKVDNTTFSCEPCPPGYAGNNSSCRQCTQYKVPDDARKHCVLCPAGTGANQYDGATECIQCRDGWGQRLNVGDCKPCRQLLKGIAGTGGFCYPCPEDSEPNDYGTECVCKAGFQMNSSNVCEECPTVEERIDILQNIYVPWPFWHSHYLRDYNGLDLSNSTLELDITPSRYPNFYIRFKTNNSFQFLRNHLRITINGHLTLKYAPISDYNTPVTFKIIISANNKTITLQGPSNSFTITDDNISSDNFSIDNYSFIGYARNSNFRINRFSFIKQIKQC